MVAVVGRHGGNDMVAGVGYWQWWYGMLADLG